MVDYMVDNYVRTVIEHFIPPQKTFYFPKTNFWLRPWSICSGKCHAAKFDWAPTHMIAVNTYTVCQKTVQVLFF